MADAIPVTAPAEAATPAPAEDRLMPAAEAPKAPPKPPKVDKGELDALVAAAKKEGKTATIFGNAVRVDN